MKKISKILVCSLLALVFLLQAVSCGSSSNEATNTPASGNESASGASKNPGEKKYDPETTPLRLAIGLPDGVFHPMFSTSAYDSEIAGMTQIGMLSADSKGGVACGEDEMVVTLDWKQVMTDESGAEVTDGTKAKYTTYSFLLKNGIKFSDGKELTIKDVLFNMYCLLDPTYNGSATMYSVKIVGLDAYRTQNPDANIDYLEQFEQKIATNVVTRLDRFKTYYTAKNDKDTETLASLKKYEEEILSDYELACRLFKEELHTDYISATDSVADYKEDYVFHYGGQAWEVFCLTEGLISIKSTAGKFDKDENGKYILNDYSDIYEAVSAVGTEETDIKQCVLDLAFSTYSTNSGIVQVVTVWATASTITEELKVEERAKLLQNTTDSNGELKVKNISGITYEEGVKTFNGVEYQDEHTVLNIKINGVDPKAIWDFAFTVTPMHYYSNEEQCNLWDGDSHFGIKFGDTEFRDKVLKASNKIGLPIGAGPYKATNAPGTDSLTKNTFFRDNMVYFERNPYFYTVGKGLSNPKIKYVRYKVISSELMLTALKNNEIDFAEISAKQENIAELNNKKDLLSYSFQDNNGYGYVGINPRYVSDPVVRRAIMYAMDTSIIINSYYTNGMGSIIYRPMSTNSWAYPENATEDFYHIDEEVLVNEISKMLKMEGYKMGPNGVMGKEDSSGKFQPLKYTFTIAGETTDHPAYTMFSQAKKILEQVGMDITIKTDSQALAKLANGSLAVWAAAWSSAIDPDLYQVYHKDSKATSVLNWGYNFIMNDSGNTYNKTITLMSYKMKYVEATKNKTRVTTKQLIEELSKIIDLARSTLNQRERKAYYSDALDVIMELAIELPTYQRKNLYAYNSVRIDASSLTPESEITMYNGLMSKIWEVEFN